MIRLFVVLVLANRRRRSGLRPATVQQTVAAEAPSWATKDLSRGIIGTDTSHVPVFTDMFQSHPEWRIKVVVAFKGGSPDLPTSANRVEGFAKTIHDKNGVEIVDSIDALLERWTWSCSKAWTDGATLRKPRPF